MHNSKFCLFVASLVRSKPCNKNIRLLGNKHGYRNAGKLQRVSEIKT